MKRFLTVLMMLFVGCSAFATSFTKDVERLKNDCLEFAASVIVDSSDEHIKEIYEDVIKEAEELSEKFLSEMNEAIQALIDLSEPKKIKAEKSQEQIIRERDCAIARFEAEEVEREKWAKVMASIEEGTLFQYDFNEDIHPFKELTVRVTSIKDEIVPFRTLMIKL